MDNMETLVRDTLQDQAAGAPSADGLLAAVTDRDRRRRRRWPAVAAAAVVVAVAAALAVTQGRPGSSPRPPAAGTTTPPSVTDRTPAPVPTPPGYRRIGYHGITLAVPERLPVLTVPCSLPAEYVEAVDPSVMYDCAASGRGPAHTRLTVRLTSDPQAVAPLARTPVVVDGEPARIGYGTITRYPGAGGQLVLNSAGVTITVTAPDRDTVRTILTSAHLGPDPLGCPSTLPDTVTNPAAATLIPGQPRSAAWCVFASPAGGVRWLLASYRVQAGELGGLVQAVDALPIGAAGSDPGAFFERDLLRLDYADGSSRTLALRLGDPSEYSDGQRTGLDHANVLTDRLRAATR